MKPYRAIIIEPNLDRRMRLKAATSSVGRFGKVELLGGINEGQSRVCSGEPLNMVFLSHSFDNTALLEFIKEAKEQDCSEDAAIVLILGSSRQDSSHVAETMMLGADGLLFEPYSVDQLTEIAALADRVKHERGAAREAAALQFLLDDLIKHVDLLAHLKSCGYDIRRGMRRFTEISNLVQRLDGEIKSRYYQMAIEAFANAPLPRQFMGRNYHGASQRVKRMMEEKLLNELEHAEEFTPPKALTKITHE